VRAEEDGAQLGAHADGDAEVGRAVPARRRGCDGDSSGGDAERENDQTAAHDEAPSVDDDRSLVRTRQAAAKRS
jgi:hypothetical protein